MRRLAKIWALGVVFSVPLLASACGSEHITASTSDASVYAGAQLFSERCAGCHTLNVAGTHGSAPNIRTAQANSGPNFNVRCERPVTRVLYAIENGGFSGAYMPQNIVVGQDATNVAKFVATYAGRLAPKETGVVTCQDKAIGTLPTPGQPATTVTTGGNTGTATAKAPTTTAPGNGNGAASGKGG
ncbi:MAG: c-type cytochrome [Solirubrobacterales bacterium]|nr:c-type cytochrome [Solirubrobacterales bacterium]